MFGYCDKPFTVPHNLVIKDGKSYKCLDCDQKLSRASDLKKHMDHFHSRQIYQAKVLREDSLHSSMFIFRCKAYFNCYSCPYTSRSETTLTQHIQKHTAKNPKKCTDCDVLFGDDSELKRHILVHSLFKPENCTYYPNNCTTQRDLQRHILVHTKEKPHIVVSTVLGLKGHSTT